MNTKTFFHKVNHKLAQLRRRALYGFSKISGKRCRCNICNRQFGYFLPYTCNKKELRQREKTIKEKGIIASPQNTFYCPYCLSTSRDRHFKAMFEKIHFEETYLKPGTKVLHFAPEAGLSQIFIQHQCEYFPVDIDVERYSNIPGIRQADICDIPFPDNMFDMIVCIHVLEHIPDDGKALSELYRVLKPGGIALLQTPFSEKLEKTFVDPNVKTVEDQIQAYVEEGHVRIYGKDLFDRYWNAGFHLDFVSSSSFFSERDSRKYGFNNKEDLMLVTKPALKELSFAN